MNFTYTTTGKRQTMTDPSGVTTYTYDPQTDRLVSKQTPFGTISYTYDAINRGQTGRLLLFWQTAYDGGPERPGHVHLRHGRDKPGTDGTFTAILANG